MIFCIKKNNFKKIGKSIKNIKLGQNYIFHWKNESVLEIPISIYSSHIWMHKKWMISFPRISSLGKILSLGSIYIIKMINTQVGHIILHSTQSFNFLMLIIVNGHIVLSLESKMRIKTGSLLTCDSTCLRLLKHNENYC